MIIIYNHIIGATSTLDTLAPFSFYMRDSFIIYRSFYEAICDLDADSQAQVFKAICEYSLNFTEIELTGIAKTIFKLIKPQLDANNKRFENGSKPKTIQKESKSEAKEKQIISKNEANNNVNDNNNVNKNVNANKNNNNNKNIIDCIFSFSDFWQLYPNKVSKSKCEEKYYKLSVKEIEQIKTTLIDFVKYKPFDSYNHPNPETYLNQKRWNDEIKEKIEKQNESKYFTFYNHLLGRDVNEPIPEGLVLKHGYKYAYDYSRKIVCQIPA